MPPKYWRLNVPGPAEVVVSGSFNVKEVQDSEAASDVKKINIENNGRSPDTMEKLGSIPRTPTLRVLAAQQDLASNF